MVGLPARRGFAANTSLLEARGSHPPNETRLLSGFAQRENCAINQELSTAEIFRPWAYAHRTVSNERVITECHEELSIREQVLEGIAKATNLEALEKVRVASMVKKKGLLRQSMRSGMGQVPESSA